MMMNPDVDDYTKTVHHQKCSEKQKINLLKPKEYKPEI